MIRKLLIALMVLGLSTSLAMAGSSEDNRGDSTILLGYTPFGLHFSTLVAPPWTVGVYLNESFLVGGEYGSATATGDDGDTKYDATYTNIGAYARWFPGNSFNFLLAYHQRTFDMKTTTSETLCDYNGTNCQTAWATADLIATANVASLGVGNQWTMDWGMTIGADWAILSALVGSESKATIRTNIGYDTEAEQAELKKDLEKIGDDVNFLSALPGALNFFIGFSF